MKQRIQFSTRDGARIAFATVGEGPPLVRVSNWFTHLEIDWNSPVWRHWLEAFTHGRILVRYDPRGSGLSDRNLTDFRSMPGWQTSKRWSMLSACTGFRSLDCARVARLQRGELSGLK
jgi:hypothetical protein